MDKDNGVEHEPAKEPRTSPELESASDDFDGSNDLSTTNSTLDSSPEQPRKRKCRPSKAKRVRMAKRAQQAQQAQESQEAAAANPALIPLPLDLTQ